ncbi:hypothetical protein F511_39576 [Dorcoceras hygrometricum]|uniref:Uncharacterized protein n=1 Tax=Dorcoceras hygrometricum TaxID=472368 RepID=A0A2Z7DDE5_9LAMI|nr:hypothetical protein F511_39576 [Dorcoceras hygrometricum]
MTTSFAIQEEEESQAEAGTMKKSAGALSVDDISSDVIIQQEVQWNRISREIQPAVDIWSWRLQNDVARRPRNQLEHDEPAETMTTSFAIQEEEESQAEAGTMKKSAGALSVDDISSDVIIQQEVQWNRISREIQPAVDIWSWRLQNDVA